MVINSKDEEEVIEIKKGRADRNPSQFPHSPIIGLKLDDLFCTARLVVPYGMHTDEELRNAKKAGIQRCKRKRQTC